jgi:hypothetical protein
MKKVLFAAAALVLATPAFAQSYDPSVGSGNLVQSQASRPDVFTQYAPQSAAGAFAQVPSRTHARASRAVQPSFTVYDEYGHVIGADPDPNVRLQLRRDADTIE